MTDKRFTEARVLRLHWEERAHAVQEATLEVEHPNGDRQLFVIPIVRMSDRLSMDVTTPATTPTDDA